MATVTGYIEKVKYRNEDNGYSIISVSSDGDEYILVGTFPYMEEGGYIEATGQMKVHPVYGEQLAVTEYEIKQPEDTKSIERYLSSGAIKGIGEALAKRIVKKFKSDTLRIMEEEPERLSEIKGISERIAMVISEQIEEKRDMRDAMMFLSKYGISMNLAVRIYKAYGPSLYSIIKENPYKLADDISGVGFKIADDIAIKAGIHVDSDFRIMSGVQYVLNQAAGQGHMYLPEDELLIRCKDLLGVENLNLTEHLSEMQIAKRIVVKREADMNIIYLMTYYYVELNTAKMLHDLNVNNKEDEKLILSTVKDIEQREHIELDELQRQACIKAVNSGLLVITGGPGTGKTTTINTIIEYFEMQGMEILLAAPTGRAAKRMTEATHHEAKTIHRLLEVAGMVNSDGPTDSSSGTHFERNEDNPLEADVVIIDEMSMVDIYLMNSLLKAVSVGSRLILVGDTNQLPSVGPGNVLRDIIASEEFNIVKLDKIYRQAAESDIVVNAHKMIDGEEIDLSKKSKDFLFIKREDPDAIMNAMLSLIRDKLPDYVHSDVSEIQIMTPMRKGVLGIEKLNTVLQQYLNPPKNTKPEKEYNSVIYREGDKVMQIKNNYQRDWEVRNQMGVAIERGMGVYNGDTGIIREVNDFAETISVEYDEGRIAEYAYQDLDELEQAYAITIHKSQGSEYPAVIIPVYPGPRMLMTRNLIYTAVTRAKQCVVLVGLPQTFFQMVSNTQELRRYSGLSNRIKELYI